MEYRYDLGIIGCGNMAKAIIAGLDKLPRTPRVAVSDLMPTNADGVNADFFSDNAELAKSCKYLLFAVKPFHAKDVFARIRGVVQPEQCVISIMAGMPIQRFLAELPETRRVVRVMPNLAASVGQAMSAVSYSTDCTAEDRQFAREIFDGIGISVTVPEEQIHAVTAVSGSGPAYVYAFLKAMISTGVRLGLDPETARVLSLQTVLGAAATVKASAADLDPMIDAVCSKGGTTIEAMKVLQAKDFGGILADAMTACFDRSKEMAAQI